jgi:alpha-D-ribose 1-methylphosphonate 5-triphosphate synthase subunit PhnL
MNVRNPGPPAIAVDGLAKTFTLHTQGGARIPVFDGLRLDVMPGECVALYGPSGTGKSTLMRALYANYKPDSGVIRILHDGAPVDIASASPRTVLDIRRRTLGYVSQFLRVIPRVPTREIVAEPLRALGVPAEEALARAEAMLARLNIPEPLWALAPATFSGGEQQRVNVARGFAANFPILLLDEPTASLDAANRQIVVTLIREAKARGAAIVGIFHDAETRAAVADRLFEMTPVKNAAPAPETAAIGDAA